MFRVMGPSKPNQDVVLLLFLCAQLPSSLLVRPPHTLGRWEISGLSLPWSLPLPPKLSPSPTPTPGLPRWFGLPVGLTAVPLAVCSCLLRHDCEHPTGKEWAQASLYPQEAPLGLAPPRHTPPAC